MQTIVATFKEPTDVYVLGINFQSKEGENKNPCTFGITDDYMSIDVQGKGEEWYMDTTGYVTILSKQEFQELRSRMWDTDEGEDGEGNEGLLLKGCVGVFVIRVTNEDNEDILQNYDPDEYLMHQSFKDDQDPENYILVLPHYEEAIFTNVPKLAETLN